MKIAKIATIPSRKDLLIQTVYSLVSQVDLVKVMLNNYKEVPEELQGHDKILAILRKNQKGDAEKFLGNEKGYIFHCDDDLAYPETYIEDMIQGIKDYGCIVTLHGKTFGKKPVESYFRNYSFAYRCLGEVQEDVYVDVPGSGVLAYHTDFFNVDYDRIDKANMGDIWVAKFAKEQGVKMVLLKHSAMKDAKNPDGYLRYLWPDSETTLWKMHYYSDHSEQTELFNSF
jgi:hypothetical protein